MKQNATNHFLMNLALGRLPSMPHKAAERQPNEQGPIFRICTDAPRQEHFKMYYLNWILSLSVMP